MVRNQVRLKLTKLHCKPLIVTVPDESNDIQMTGNTEMPFLLALVNEQEYQDMLSSIDYQLIHSTAPSHIHDIALTEESDTFPSDNDWMIMDEVAPLEPELTEAGEQPRAHVGDATMGHEEVLGPTDPGSLTGPEERNRSSGGVLRGDAGLSTANPHISDNSQLNSGSDVNHPPASDALSYQGLSVEISAQVSESKLLFLLCVDLSTHVIYVG